MIPGFAERLQLEMEKLAPPAAVVEVFIVELILV